MVYTAMEEKAIQESGSHTFVGAVSEVEVLDVSTVALQTGADRVTAVRVPDFWMYRTGGARRARPHRHIANDAHVSGEYWQLEGCAESK